MLLEKEPSELVGRGAGLSDKGLKRKISAIEKGILQNYPDRNDPLDVLTKVGGFDLAAMCGVFLGGAVYGVPVLMDGFISSVSASAPLPPLPATKKVPPAR